MACETLVHVSALFESVGSAAHQGNENEKIPQPTRFLSHVLTNKENLSQKSHLLNKSVSQKECALSQNVTYSLMHCNNLVQI